MEDMLCGAAGIPQAAQWAKEFYKAIEGEIFTERFDKPSYIQRYLPGVMSTTACEVHLTNWACDVRKFGFAVAGESAAEVATRLANQQACQDAITALELLQTETYNEAFQEAVARAEDYVDSSRFARSATKSFTGPCGRRHLEPASTLRG